MKTGDHVIYFQPNGFDTPKHRKATVEALTFGKIDGHRAHIAIDAVDGIHRDWVRESSLQPYSDALWDTIERWHEEQKQIEMSYKYNCSKCGYGTDSMLSMSMHIGGCVLKRSPVIIIVAIIALLV